MFSPVKGLLVLTSALLAAPSQIPAQECSRLEGASPDELTSYLDKTPRSPQNEACGALAISQLGGMRYKAAIPALTKWLELRWPPNAHQKPRAPRPAPASQAGMPGCLTALQLPNPAAHTASCSGRASLPGGTGGAEPPTLPAKRRIHPFSRG